jgi:hypothetical protein
MDAFPSLFKEGWRVSAGVVAGYLFLVVALPGFNAYVSI